MPPPANIGPMAECYLETGLTGGPLLAAICQQICYGLGVLNITHTYRTGNSFNACLCVVLVQNQWHT